MRGKIFFLIGFALVSSACTKPSRTRADTLYFALSDSPKTLDPRFSTDANGQRINGLLFNSLVKIAADLSLAGDYAKSWTYKKNTYTFALNTGIRFSDGTPVSAEDLIYTFKFYQSEKSPYKSALKTISNLKVDFTKVIPTLSFTVSKYSAALLGDLTLIKILPKHVVEQYGEDFSQHLVGSGSFAFVSQSANEIVLDSRAEHVLIVPAIKKVVFKIIQDDNTRYLQTLKGNIDIVQTGIPLSKVKSFENKPDFEIFTYVGPSMNYLLLNFKDPLLKEKKIREEIDKAINRNEIISYKLEGFGIPATSILPPNNPFFNSDLKPTAFDSTVSKDPLLKNAQFTLKTSNNQETVEIGKVLASQLEKIGIQTKLQSYEWGTFYDDVKKGNFQVAMMRWVGTLDPDIYRDAFHSSEVPPGRNRGSYVNKDLDRLLEDGLAITDVKKRIDHYKKIQEIVYSDLAIIPLWYNTQVSIVNKRIKNYAPSINGDFSPALVVSKE